MKIRPMISLGKMNFSPVVWEWDPGNFCFSIQSKPKLCFVVDRFKGIDGVTVTFWNICILWLDISYFGP